MQKTPSGLLDPANKTSMMLMLLLSQVEADEVGEA